MSCLILFMHMWGKGWMSALSSVMGLELCLMLQQLPEHTTLDPQHMHVYDT